MSEVTQPSSGRALSRIYRVCGVVFGLGGVAVAVWEPFDSSSDVKYAPLVGISVFAVLYVIAQAVERLVEWVVDILTLLRLSRFLCKRSASVGFVRSYRWGLMRSG